MSRQMVISFLGKLDGDASMQAQVKNLEGDLPGLIGLAARAGFAFTPEDWNGPPFLNFSRNTYLAAFLAPRLAMKI